MLWFILFIVLLICGCIVVYKTAEVHELHKMRAAFDNKEHAIKELMGERKNDSNFNFDYYQGELEELEEMKIMIENRINELKFYDINKE